MKQLVLYLLLIVLGFNSCTEENDMPEFPTKYARILQQSITVKTEERNKMTIHANFDSEETAKEKFVWSVYDPELASVVTNEDNSVTITGLKAGQTTLKIESADGSLKYFSTLNIQKAPIFDPIYIDFGPLESGKPFNNFKKPSDKKLENLMDDYNHNTGYAIEVVGSFNNFEIIRNIPNTLGFPSTASNDMFFNDGIAVASAGFSLSNLNKNWKYTFVFYSSINDNNTENEYRVKGKGDEVVARLGTSNNASEVATVKGIVPDDNGKISITLQAGPNNTQWARFYNINAMMIVSEDYVLNFPLSF